MTMHTETLRRRRFNVDEIARMTDAGVFQPDEQFELIAGELFELQEVGPRHRTSVDRIAKLFAPQCKGRCLRRIQEPVQLDRRNLFRPDLMMLRPADDGFEGRHPTPADTMLMVEVVVSSLVRDRTVKLPICAQLAVPQVWIVDLKGECVHEFQLDRDRYELRLCKQLDDRLRIPDCSEVTVAELLGR